MPMTDKERGFLDYLVKRRKICTENANFYRNLLKFEEIEEEKQRIKCTVNYYHGCLDTYFDLIDAYIHTFTDK